VFSMLKFNLVLALLFVNISAYAEDEKFIGCVIERSKVSTPFGKMDATDSLIKRNQPLISVKDGKFTMLVGNFQSEELFPDGIEYHFIGEPKLSQYSNTYQWDYLKNLGKIGDRDYYENWNVIINRESLDMSESHRKTDTFGKHALDKYYSCRLIDKENFEKYKTEMSEVYMGLNADARKKEKEEQVERESKSKI
jgi:hypothetical protein